MSELSVLGAELFSGALAYESRRRVEKKRLPGVTTAATRDHTVTTALCIQSVPFAGLQPRLRLKQVTGLPTTKKAATTKTMQIVYSFRAGSQQRSRLLILWPPDTTSISNGRQHGQILRKPLNSPSCADGACQIDRARPGNVKPRPAPDPGRRQAVHGFQC